MPVNYYEVLNLSAPPVNGGPSLTPAALKAAYHRALLQHHPDKNPSLLDAGSEKKVHAQSLCETRQECLPKKGQESHITVDEITLAYITLSSPSSRAEYDRELRLRPILSAASLTDGTQHVASPSGLEHIDLDDLFYDASAHLWWKNCRCATSRAFVITEEDLERAVEDLEEAGNKASTAEVIVPCQGCSLGLKVGFAIEKG